MLPELKLKLYFPGVGSIELEGEGACTDNSFQGVSIKFTPCNSGKANHGVVIKLRCNGNYNIQDLNPRVKEEEIDGVGIA